MMLSKKGKSPNQFWGGSRLVSLAVSGSLVFSLFGMPAFASTNAQAEEQNNQPVLESVIATDSTGTGAAEGVTGSTDGTTSTTVSLNSDNSQPENGEEANSPAAQAEAEPEASTLSTQADLTAQADLPTSGECGAVPGTVFWEYNKDTKTLRIYGNGAMKDHDSSCAIGHYHVYETEIKTVNIEPGVTHIGSNSFSMARSLSNINIAPSVTSIGSQAFNNCNALTNLVIPESVTEIGVRAFAYCSGLTSVSVTDKLTTLGNHVFYNTPDLKTVWIKQSSASEEALKSIKDLFENKDTLFLFESSTGELTVKDKTGALAISPNGEVIAENLSQDKWVKNSDGSVKVTIDENLSVNISASGEIVEETKAPTIIVNKHEVNFGDTAINLKGGVQRIKISPSHQRCELKYELGGTNPDAFIVSEEEWDPYTGGTLSVDFLPTAASEYSATLTITSHDGNPVTIQLSGKGIQDQVTKSGSISKNGSDVKYEYFRGSKTLRIYGTGEMQSWNGWEGVYPAWMWWSDDISRVVIEEGVTSIGNCAFLMCKNLTSVSIPSTVATVESGAFYECTKLTTIEFPDSVQTIEDSVFYDCWELTSVKLPKNLKVIDGFLFYNCYKLSSVNIPDGVEEIKLGAFYQCFDLPSINLPEGLATLEQYAFAGCESVTNVKIPAGVTNIGNNAFESCVNLKTVELPSTLESIDVQAFYNYISLETVSFPETLSLIGDNAFGECSSLTSVKLSESLRTLGKDAFSNCTNLELLEIAPGLTSIGETAFSGCSKLALATIPDTVNSLEKGAFYGCSNLKALSLPGVTFIGENALDNMTALEEVELNASTPITLGAGNFTSDKVRILVPAGTADAYKAAPGFNAIPEKIYDNASDFHPVLDQNGYADAYAAQEWQADENGHWKWCAVCSSYKVAYEAHNQDTTVAGTAATCITDGLTDGANCSVCGVETRNQQAINALTHEMQEVAGTAQASTCTQTGKEADKQCARTGCDYRETGATIEVVAHDYEMKIISQPTVEAVGSKQEVCKVCGDAKEAIVIEKLPAPAQPAPVQPEQQQPAASAQPAQPVQPEQKPAQPTDSVVQQPEQQVQPEQPAQPVQPIAPEISTAAQQIVATSEFAANTEATAPDNASQSTEKAEATNVEDKGAAQEAVAENENPLAKSATPADQNQGLGFNILEGLYLALAGLAAAVLGFFVVIRRKRNKEEQ